MKAKHLRSLFLILLVNFLLISSAFALSLDEAKSKGLVGEHYSGYLAPVVQNHEANALISEINAKRKKKYEEIAKRNGTPLNSVEALAGQKAIENTPAGQFVQTPDGVWRKK